MTEERDIRYSTKGILATLAVIALATILLTNVLNIVSLLEGNSSYSFEYYNLINDSLYNNVDYRDSEYFKFYVKSDKVINYPMTPEYRMNNSETVAAQRVDGSYEYFYDYETYLNSSHHGYFVKNNVDNPENPKYGINYLTNDEVFTREFGKDFKFDPLTMTFKNNYAVVQGTWTRESLKIEPVIYMGDDKRIRNETVSLENSIKQAYTFINPRENGIRRLDFVYVVDVNSPYFQNRQEMELQRNVYIPQLFVFSLISLLLVLGFGILTDYDIAKNVGFYKSISRFPIDIVIILTLLLITPFYLIENIHYTSEILLDMKILIAIGQIFLTFFGGISVLYFVYGTKSIYHNGIKSFIFQNSLLGKLIRGLFNITVGFVMKHTNNLEGTSKKSILLIYGGLIFLGYLGTRMFVVYGMKSIIFILWVLLISGMFAYFKKYYDDIVELEEASNLLAGGNYEAKVDENKTHFQTMAHNLNTVGNNLDLAVEKAIKSERLKTELITNVSHDLKTPLTSIINYSELIADGDASPEELKEYAQVINEKSHRLKELIEGLFEVSKVSSNSIDLNMEEIDLGQLLEQIYGEWEDKLTEKNITTNLNTPELPVIIELDGTQTSRILENLFSNIYKYSLENTRVYVDLFEKDGVELVIKNISKYPLNISPEELMERFTRGDESRSTEGSGLGLSIANSLTEIQGGTFNIEIDGDLFKTTIRF